MIKHVLISAVALACSTVSLAAETLPGEKTRMFHHSCQQEKRAALRSCKMEFNSAVEKLLSGKSQDAKGTLAMENTLLSLCELEADRTYDYCRMAGYFQGTNIVDIVQQDQLGTGMLNVNGDDDTNNEELVPLLSGSTYRTISKMCHELPGGASLTPGGGGVLKSWTGIDLQGGCLDDLWDACMDDSEMGSNIEGTATHSTSGSERLENCMEAIYMWDIPVL